MLIWYQPTEPITSPESHGFLPKEYMKGLGEPVFSVTLANTVSSHDLERVARFFVTETH